uniref:CD209 antigen-like protein E n=1 Tax=Monopterus albus TaxID=43700 RepID=UPI0009B47B45|nr:CD209 antigen-like protein E [Monopterus albus]
MEPQEQIYMNVEELGVVCSTAGGGTGTIPVRTDVVAREETETWSCSKVATLCLGLLCFLLLVIVIGVSALYNKQVHQLSRVLANYTAEKHQLLVRYQNLTDERDQLQTSFNRVMENTGTCPNGWRRFGCKCYYFSTTLGSWPNSKQQCSNQRADLVIINSRQEMEFLNQLGAHLKFWIGLSQTPSQSMWVWTDGTSLGTAHWQNGIPIYYQHYRTQSCAAFNSFQAGGFEQTVKSWSMEQCTQYLRWVCEREADMPL